MHQTQEGFVKIDQTHVVQHLGDKTGVKQMHGRMFSTADIHIHRKQTVDEGAVERLFLIVIVGIA